MTEVFFGSEDLALTQVLQKTCQASECGGVKLAPSTVTISQNPSSNMGLASSPVKGRPLRGARENPGATEMVMALW